MSNRPSLKIAPGTRPLEILAFLRAVEQTSGFSGARNLRAVEETVVGKDGTCHKFTVLFVRAGPECVLQWLTNTWNRKEQRLLAAKVVFDAVPHSSAKDLKSDLQSIAAPMCLSVASAKSMLDPLASTLDEQKRALINLRKRAVARLSSREHVSRGLSLLEKSNLCAHWLIRLPQFLLGKPGKDDKAQHEVIAAFAPVEKLISLLLKQNPTVIQTLDKQQAQDLISGVHKFAMNWNISVRNKPVSHGRLIRDFPELAAIDWLLASFSATCPDPFR
ncbi:hypothetical protein KTQ42_10355|uniref:hypothetical protein n=1 Tax=Noviherbaspirillum sp. L7-7A TaxID=2850560 RepID=UPI001C2C0D64|nr:hypothetical protein [Noviherbaspirillum sp. L7-7A]MBV0879702.1 hypothetical protein [Noviherbaspirillum sp. L7-7A]